jgi:hypothetical protein
LNHRWLNHQIRRDAKGVIDDSRRPPQVESWQYRKVCQLEPVTTTKYLAPRYVRISPNATRMTCEDYGCASVTIASVAIVR